MIISLLRKLKLIGNYFVGSLLELLKYLTEKYYLKYLEQTMKPPALDKFMAILE